jgi:hypothetical protein
MTIGRQDKAVLPKRLFALRGVSLAKLTSELLARVQDGSFRANDSAILLGYEILDALPAALNVHNNPFSVRRYRDLFNAYYETVGPPYPVLDGRTIVELGSGSINPYGFLFLFLMLGAHRGIAVDLDEIQDIPKALKFLAALTARMLIDPREVIGDYPINREEVMRNIATFDLAKLHRGDPLGLDPERLSFRQESCHALSLLEAEVDFMISNAFFEHIPCAEEAIAEMARTMRKDAVGVHTIDGSDHKRYDNPACHPLEFLTEANNEALVHGSNRIRPLEFKCLFERNGFVVISCVPFERVEVTRELRNRLVDPFRSMPDDVLSTVMAKFVIRRL